MLPTLPASCSRSSTTLGACRPAAAPAPAASTRSRCGAGDSSVAEPAISARRRRRATRGRAGQRAQRRPCPGRLGDHRLRRRPPALRARPRTGARLRARPRRACGRPPGRASSLRRRTSSGLSREVMSRRCRGHARQNSRSSTLAHRREAAPVLRAGAVLAQRRQVLRRGVALVVVEAVLRMLVVQLRAAAGRGAPWRGSTRPRSPRTLASPPTIASRPASSAPAAGCRRPAPRPAAGAGPRPRAASPAASACRMLSGRSPRRWPRRR